MNTMKVSAADIANKERRSRRDDDGGRGRDDDRSQSVHAELADGYLYNVLYSFLL